ncbi:MAG: helix-hairpin-helix domain-containing protein [Methanothrix sp.]
MNRTQYTRLEQIPYDMYKELCRKTRKRHDPCVIDAFISAVRFMEGEPKRPWRAYTSERKHRLAGMESFGPTN